MAYYVYLRVTTEVKLAGFSRTDHGTLGQPIDDGRIVDTSLVCGGLIVVGVDGHRDVKVIMTQQRVVPLGLRVRYQVVRIELD